MISQEPIKDIFLQSINENPSVAPEWENAIYKNMRRVQIDKRGAIGESFIENILKKLGNDIDRTDATDRTLKHWDIRDKTNRIDLEVKLATLGANKRTFQYEAFERDRNYHAVILIGAAPNDIYLKCVPKFQIPFKKANDIFTKTKRALHRRGHGIQYKWTLNLSDFKESELIRTLDDFQRSYQVMLDTIENRRKRKGAD